MVKSLRDATVQEIQLELIRRTQFNSFRGEQIYESLIRHRELWFAVLLARPGSVTRPKNVLLPPCSLITLRDLPQNVWNADQLFVLTETVEQAKRIAKIAKDEEWCGEVEFHNEEEIDYALGIGRMEFGLVSFWWD